MAFPLVQENSKQASLPFSLTKKEEKLGLVMTDPSLFTTHFLQTDLWDTQKKILQALTKPQARVAVKACHSSSKTFTAARAVLWFLARYKEAICVTTAPTWGQVEKLLWGEIHSALLKSIFPFPVALKTHLELGPKRYAYGLSTSVTKQDEGVKFQGIHADNVLMVLDEAPGVHPKIWEAMEGARAGGNVRILAIGNPTITSGPFHDAFVDNRSGWDCITISAFDTPNFKGLDLKTLIDPSYPDEELDNNERPYLTTRRWVKEKYYEWGEGHPLWESRVLGEFPKQSEDSLLSLSWLEEASIRELKGKGTDKLVAGLDVAGPGEDETSLTIRRGPEIILHKQWPIADPRGEIVRELMPYKNELSAVNVDAVAIGWYIYKHLEDLKFPAVPIIAQAPSTDSEKYADLKAEFYWGLRMRLASGDFSGLTDEKTIGQLAGIRYKPTPRGQIGIESKQKAKEQRGVHSPDRAESVMLAFAERTLTFGVLDYNAAEKQRVEFEKQIEVNTAINKVAVVLSCEKCSAICIAPCQGGFRCNACGYQWNDKAKTQKQAERKTIVAQNDPRLIRSIRFHD